MRNPALEALDVLVGEWRLTLTNAWFLDALDIEQHGAASIRWIGESFLEMEAEMNGEHIWHLVFGRSDANERLVALYHDPRPTSRVFDMTFGDGEWTLSRRDPDFHQRMVSRVGRDRIDGHWDASDDGGTTWRKDFDLIFER